MRVMLSSTANALLAWRTAKVCEFWLLFDGFYRIVAETYSPQFLTIAETSPRPRIREDLAPFCQAPPLFVWLVGSFGTRRGQPPRDAAAAIPYNESQGAGIRPGARIGRAHHWQPKGSCSAQC